MITPYQLVRLLTTLITLVDSIKTTAMVNSGAMGNFIHPQFVKEHKLVTKNCTPLIVNDMNSQLLLCVDQQVEVQMMVGNHSETLTFDITPLGKHNIVLGLLWLQQHNPTIHWMSGKVTFTSDYCEEHCLAQPASTFLNQRPIVPWVTMESKVSELTVKPLSEQEINLFTVEILEHLESVTKQIPKPYHIKINVFNGQKVVNMLPPLCSPDVDFVIELDETKPLLKPSCPYHMNQEECAECWRLLDEGLESGLMEPAYPKCLIAAPMFFVWKKDGTQQPVINYWKLNEIMIKDSYPLPHINKMMDHIHRSEFFTKFNLKLGYNQIHIQPGDKWKTTFMTPFRPF